MRSSPRTLLAALSVLCSVFVVVGLLSGGSGGSGRSGRSGRSSETNVPASRAESASGPGPAVQSDAAPPLPGLAPTALARSTPAVHDEVAPLVATPETITVRLVVPDWTTDEQRQALRSSTVTVAGSAPGEASGMHDPFGIPVHGFDERLCASIEIPYRSAQLDVTRPLWASDYRGIDPFATPEPGLPSVIADTRVVGSPGARTIEVQLVPQPVWYLRFEGPDGRAPAELRAWSEHTSEVLHSWPVTGDDYALLIVRGGQYAGRPLVARAAECDPFVVELPEAHRTGRPVELGPFRLRASIPLAGRIVDAEGMPVANFSVCMLVKVRDVIESSGDTTTDSEGNFVLRPPSDASVALFGVGDLRGEQHVVGLFDVGTSRSPVIATAIRLPTVTLVLTGDGLPQGGIANVSFASLDDPSPGTRESKMPVEEGRIVLGAIQPGRWRIQVQQDGASGEIVFDATEGHREIELELAR